jgi:hypothetical protein
MDTSVKEQNLRRYRKALSEATTIEHRVIFSALISHLEGEELPESFERQSKSSAA